ncbi:D-glycerate dehydrogenase [Halobacillus salinarum]|uniref:D-glycerate dehydrogenase n=1 Tax=Halobacillus salinarum TaxID=2932257 RepID=A0ABY4EPG2_9BACI|nr:D-glycerate dehydrogenase [Halobacillus salinarum]UOQ46048.1 D-glycerate dehydrogenase [Halobacillus salinarum]
MDKPHIFITRKLPDEIIDPYRQYFQIEMWPEEEEPVDKATLQSKASKADAVLTMLTEKLDASLFANAGKLKVVANLAVGYDNIDLDAAREHQVTVTNTPDVLTDTTADLTFGLLMATARRIVEGEQYIKNGNWNHWSPLLMAGRDIHHKTIGIVGMGRIGETVAKRTMGFDMNILYHNRSRKPEAEEKFGATYTSFEHLLEASDYVVCLAPLTKETQKMFGKQAFEKMKSDAIFINASRGGLVDEQALYDALEDGQIKAAGLDVFENEPISAEHPLLKLPQVVCLPHIGSASRETRVKMMELALDNIKEVLEGNEPITPVS